MNSKTVYQYDETGAYAGPTQADESPREPGVYLLPARCTEVAPPEEIPADKWPRWNGKEWQIANKPAQANRDDPVNKLKEFLANNPDVEELLKAGN